MNHRGTTLVAAVLAAAALAPCPAAADALSEAERHTTAAEQRLQVVERVGAAPDVPAAMRAARKAELGENQALLGDWFHAAIALDDAVNEPAFRSSSDRPHALFILADALRRQGECGAARVRYAEYLALEDVEHRSDAIGGALDCAVKEHRYRDAEQLLTQAGRAYKGDLPVEVRYLAAKGMYERVDLTTTERYKRAAKLFEQVGPPYQQQAWYFQGVIQIQLGNLHGSLQWFDACARAEAPPGPQAEVRELCVLALGRVHAQMGNLPAALEWYAAIPSDSPRFPESMYEIAWTYVHAKQYEMALRMASFVPELAPDSPLAPEATVLQGNLFLKLGRFSDATDAYNRVINGFAPVRDEIDALLSMNEDPVRYFNELIGREGKAFDISTVLPPVAVRWASTDKDVSVALDLVRQLDATRRDLADAKDLAGRIEALLARGGGLDAFPRMQRAYADAHAVENDAACIEAGLVGALSVVAEAVVPGDRKAELRRARKERQMLEARVEALPRTPEEVGARFDAMHRRIDEVDRAAYRLGYETNSILAAVAGTEAWIDLNRNELGTDAEGRDEFTNELRKHREAAARYEEQLRALRADIARARDAAAGALAMTEEARIRARYLEAIERERTVAETARGSLPPQQRALFDRSDRTRERLAAIRSRARGVKIGIANDAAARASELRGRVNAERVAIAGHGGTLDVIQSVSKDVVGRIAVKSISDVRAQFYKVILKADVGMVDVAWSRKRARLDKIQQLTMQKAAEVDALDREYRSLVREAD